MRTPLQRIRIGAISLAVIFLLSVLGFRLLGEMEWVESIWMVVITVSTVGYGESSAQSSAVQLLTVAVILFGVSAAAYTFGGFMQLALEGEVNRALGRRKMTKEIGKLNQHVVICGFGRIGEDLARQLGHREIPFIVIDRDDQRTEAASKIGGLVVTGDATLEAILEQVQLPKARAIVTALPSDAENVFITLTARNLCPNIQIIAKSEQESSCRKLRQAGADKIVMPHRVGAQQMERMISRPNTANLVELFAESSSLDMELDEVLVVKSSTLVGKTLVDSGIKKQFNLLLVGIQSPEGKLNFNPSPDTTIQVNDTLMLIGEMKDIKEMMRASGLGLTL